MSRREIWKEISNLSEDALRIEVILPLLHRTPNLTGITDVHGTNEQGLDLIFFDESEIRRTCYGMQIKKGSISGGATQQGTVKEIVDQLELARDFEHPIAVGGAGKYKIDFFVVAASGKISNQARDEIASRLSSTTVDFWDSHEILRRMTKYFPALLTGLDVNTISYLQNVIKFANRLDALDQIPGVAHRTLADVFTEPFLRRKYDPAIGSGKDVHEPHTLPALRLLLSDENAVIVADQNEGKTSILKMMVIRRAEAVLAGKPPELHSLPLYIRASEVLERGTIPAAARHALEALSGGDLAQQVEEDLSSGLYLLCFDGFSELTTEKKRDDCAAIVEAYAAANVNVRMIIAGRPADFLQPKYFTEFRQYVIEPLNTGQVTELIHHWTKDSDHLVDVAQRMVTRIREALQLPGSPITAVIGVMLYEEEHRYITNTADAVDRYMVIRLGRYSRELGVPQQVEWSRKQDLLSEVAFEMVSDDFSELSEEDYVSRFDNIHDRLGEKRRGQTAFDELVKGGVLVS